MLEQERATHREDLAQLAEEFDGLRRERDTALSTAEEAKQARDRMVAEQQELDTSSREAELARLSEQCEQLRREAQTEKSRGDSLAEEVEALRVQRPSVRVGENIVESWFQDQVDETAGSPPAPAGPESAGPKLAEVQTQLQQAEVARSLLVDALKVAQKQIEELSVDLDEARLEQQRVRAILDGMGIHLV
jgi:hypothetical protein